MSGIISYPVTTPELDDLLLGTEMKEDGNTTKNFQMNSVRVLFAENTPIQVAPELFGAMDTNDDLRSQINITDTIRLGANINSSVNNVYYADSSGRFIFKPGLYYIKIKAQVGNDYNEAPGSLFLGRFLNGTMIDKPTMISVAGRNAFTAYTESFWLTVENEGDYLTFGITAKTISGVEPAKIQATDPNTNGWTEHSSPFSIDISKVNLV